MTLNSTTNRISYAGNGVTTVFSFPYRFLANADLVVIERNDTTGVETAKTLTTHYTVSGAGDAAGGSVTMLTAPASGVSLVIYRDPALTQLVDLVENDPLPVETAVEQPLDRLTMIAQRNRDLIGRSLRIPEGDTGFTEDDMYLPAEVARANKYLAFDADGKPTPSVGTGADSGLRTDLADSSAVGNGDAMVAGKRTAANATAFTQHAYHEARVFYLDLDFGAVGDGTTDDTNAFVNAASALRALGGGTLVLSPGKTYKVLPTGGTAGASLVNLQNCVGVTIEGRGARILTGSVTAVQYLFDLNASTDVIIRNLKLQSGYALLDATSGIDWIVARQGAKRIHLSNLDFKYGRIGFGALGALSGSGTDSDRARGIVAFNCSFDTTYYPLNFQGAGDNFFARGIYTANCGRSYFPYNVRNHDVWIDSTPGGPYDDVLLKVYGDTRYYSRLENINLVYRSPGRATGSGNQSADNAHVAVEFQWNDAVNGGEGFIDNVNILIDVEPTPAPAQSTSVFILRKHDDAGNPDATGRGHQIQGLRVNGVGRSLQNLSGQWFRFCTRAGETWTGESIYNTRIGFTGAGAPGQTALAINGAGLLGTSASPSLLVDGFFANDSQLSLTGVSAKHLAIHNSNFGNYRALSRNTEKYTVTWTGSGGNPAIGNGTLEGSYVLHDGLCTANIRMLAGGTTTFGAGDWSFSLPFIVAPSADAVAVRGAAGAHDASAPLYYTGFAYANAGATVCGVATHGAAGVVGAAIPFAWAAGDQLWVTITYPIGAY